MTASVAGESIAVGVEGHGKVAVWAEGLPAAMFADGERGRTATIVKNQGLVAVFEVFGDGGEKLIGKIVIFLEVVTIFEVDNSDFGVNGGGFSAGGEFDEGFFGFGEMIIDDVRGGGAEDTGDFEACGHETGKAEGGITGRIILVVGAFVGFVDNDETEVANRGEKGRAGADDDGGFGGMEDFKPCLAAFSGGLVGVDEMDARAESLLEDVDELGSEGDFGDEEDSGLLRFKALSGHFEVDIGFTATSYASEQTSGSWGLLEGFKSILLIFGERNGGDFRGFGVFGDFWGF